MSFQSTKVLSISRCKYKFESHVVNHCHNFHHLMYVVGGSGTLSADGAVCGMNKHDMFVIQPGVYHSFVSDASQPLRTVEVKALVGDSQLEACLEAMPIRIEAPHSKIKLLLEAMLDEATYCRPQFKEIITAHFIEFIMNIRRLYGAEAEGAGAGPAGHSDEGAEREPAAKRLPVKAEAGDDLAGRAIRYIHANCDRKIVLKELARKLAVSSAHLCRVFYGKYQLTPMQYLNNWRIYETKQLLANTEMSITEISAKVGFQSVHYLSRRFAASEQLSPLQYRQRMKEIVELRIEDKLEIVDQQIVKST
ncbi:AraC family transcriptional regulator [Paenibacillus hodogayensis]|uniref:AraC family transcriptional regulator n=1 Tax=Paenibacillus hodogayensis TaxID=279208 RepID=A0ABV5VUV2_9BACL